ncbi:uncharacterized protein JCM10292_003535 [Rhodotorula paludigena]|uniref:uncharacterized protein n=1 Tax=Rhodotorula paludigena TaxID=86838 RepID=UPI0031783167
MYGGSASSGGRWSLGAKTYRAPTEGERIREAQDRLARESERRKLHEIKHEERHIRKQQRLQREAAAVNARTVGFEIGAAGLPFAGGLGGVGPGALVPRSPRGLVPPSPRALMPGSPRGLGGLGVPVSPRVRSASFSGGFGSPMLGGGRGGAAVAMERSRLQAERLALEDQRRREAELARLRAQRGRLELEAARRQRNTSAIRAERAALAAANERILASPRLSPGLAPLGYPGGTTLRRTHSWSGALPGLGGMRHSPQIVPVPVPVAVPSPRLGTLGGVGGGGFRAASPGRVRVSPRLGMSPSPRVVNYNTFNVSPRLGGLPYGDGGVGVGGLGGLGALDDLAPGGGTMVDPPLFGDSMGFDGMGAMGAGGVAGMPGAFGAQPAMDFVVTDEAMVPGRTVVQDLGTVEGLSSSTAGGAATALLSEDDKLNLAIADLTAQAQARGANAVLQVETGADVLGEILVRGRAAVLA